MQLNELKTHGLPIIFIFHIKIRRFCMTANETTIHQSSNKVNVGNCRQPYIRLPI